MHTSPPKPHRIFDSERYDFYKAFATEEAANRIAEELRKSNLYGTLFGAKARVFHLPKSQAYVEYIFSQPHYYRWAIYTKAYRLPEAEARSRTSAHEFAHDSSQRDYVDTHYDQMLEDLWGDPNRVIHYKLSIIIKNLGLPWQAPSKYSPKEKKAILNAYRTAKWVSTR